MDDLISRFGPDAKTKDIADRITCKDCGKRVAMSIYPEKTGP